ncbi:hypothetical protein Glove_120g140 [Diversispora epigaea]|uniref:Uncharacterized protein n=1 Tax=Diversispora epigaea TaxID=1348612 RepID=A0A397IZV9_9GLOM|nr:hypothetical protein Glove_120g140 [Diversispora epigaea]
MFGAHGYDSNSAGLSTPVTIPAENIKSLIDIKFTDDELWNYVKNFCNRHFVLLDNNILNNIILKFNKYIQKATAGHVGLVRHILHNTKSAMEWRIRERVLTWKDICQSQMCESVYFKGKILFKPSNKSIQQLVKSGVLVANDGNLHFSAPLIMRSFFQQCYGNHSSTEITPSSLYHFIVKTFTAICNGQSGKILKKTLGFGTDGRLLEQTWQKEFYRNGQIELLRDGKDLVEHSRRFEPAGEYKEIIK